MMGLLKTWFRVHEVLSCTQGSRGRPKDKPVIWLRELGLSFPRSDLTGSLEKDLTALNFCLWPSDSPPRGALGALGAVEQPGCTRRESGRF